MALGEVRLLLSPECLQAGCGYPGIKLLSGCLEQQPRWTPAGMEEILGIADPTQGSCFWLETNPGGPSYQTEQEATESGTGGYPCYLWCRAGDSV